MAKRKHLFHYLDGSVLNAILMGAIALGILLRIVLLGSREFWYDEVLSLLLSTGNKLLYQEPGATPVLLADYSRLLALPNETSFGEVLTTLENLFRGILAEPHPPLFFLEQHLWLRLFGNSEAAMRSVVALFSVGAIACAWGLGRCLLGDRGGLLLAAMVALNPYYLFHSLNVRMYGSLVFWVVLSGWAWAELITSQRRRAIEEQESEFQEPSVRNLSPTGTETTRKSRSEQTSENLPKKSRNWIWWPILAASVTGGILTFYYFAVWILTLAIGVLIWDRRRWWRYALAMGGGCAIASPWFLWGTRRQLGTADFDRFAAEGSFLSVVTRHVEDVLRTLGTHLWLGDWASVSPLWLTVAAGAIAIAAFIVSGWILWKHGKTDLLGIGLLMGIFPLLIMLAVDILKKQYTLGFGFGRSVIFILPGCLLLIAAAIAQLKYRRQEAIAIGLLLLYVSINLADASLRSRQMFHRIAEFLPSNASEPTLVAMDAVAWGHVLRLAYYLPDRSPVYLLVRRAPDLPSSLSRSLSETPYPSLVWLTFERPLWSPPSTEAERATIQQTLSDRYRRDRQGELRGTWNLDNLQFSLYSRKER